MKWTALSNVVLTEVLFVPDAAVENVTVLKEGFM